MSSEAAIRFRTLLGSDEPPAFTVFNPNGLAPVLVVADHASNRVPESLDRLGLERSRLDQHIGWDIGTDELAQELSELFDAPLVMAGYSRLVVDLNRNLDDATVFAEAIDGIAVPGNQNLDEVDRLSRINSLYRPYRQAIDNELDRIRARGIVPALIAIHSFTPLLNGSQRPWHVGVLWDKDPRIPVPFLRHLRAHPADLVVGDNQPYSGKQPADYTIDHHAEANGLPHVSIEVRQDLIATTNDARHWAGVLHECLRPILADPRLFSLWRQ